MSLLLLMYWPNSLIISFMALNSFLRQKNGTYHNSHSDNNHLHRTNYLLHLPYLKYTKIMPKKQKKCIVKCTFKIPNHYCWKSKFLYPCILCTISFSFCNKGIILEYRLYMIDYFSKQQERSFRKNL